MEQNNKPYEGLKCENCCYWFSKMYLFKQHYRRCHSNLGQLIDLPPLPIFEEMVMQNNLQDEVWFAILHLSPMKPILMRIFEAEGHATMRIANMDDIREQERRISAKAVKDKATIPVLYDVYSEIGSDGVQSFYAIPKQKLEPLNHHGLFSPNFCIPNDLESNTPPQLPHRHHQYQQRTKEDDVHQEDTSQLSCRTGAKLIFNLITVEKVLIGRQKLSDPAQKHGRVRFTHEPGATVHTVFVRIPCTILRGMGQESDYAPMCTVGMYSSLENEYLQTPVVDFLQRVRYSDRMQCLHGNGWSEVTETVAQQLSSPATHRFGNGTVGDRQLILT
uniref:C2H2-type domain-containing protein n=1 Tax=Anopheles culicifacies TaxID=139723 RepID=A0A182MR85_9DIPT